MNDNQRHLLWHEAHLVLTGDYWQDMLPYLRKLMRENRNRTAVPPKCKHRFVRVNFNTAIDGENPVCADCGKKIKNYVVKVNNKSSQKEGLHGSCF